MKPGLLIAIGFFLVLAARSQSLTIVDNGRSDYCIVLPAESDSLQKRAATELQRYIRQISGVKIPIVRGKLKKNILVGTDKLQRGGSALTHSWEVTGKDLYIHGSTPYQTLETVYVLLEQEMGCQFLSPDMEIVPQRNTLQVKPFRYNPPVKTRTVHAKLFYDNPAFAAKRRVTTEGFPGFVKGGAVHTFHRFVPEKQYYKSQPGLFALVNGKRLPTQLCLSNDTVYRMIRDSVKAWFARDPSATVVSVSQDDNTQYCTCSRCKAYDDAGGSPSASMIRLVNRIAQAFPDKTISTLAYQYTRRAPANIKPEKNVLVTLCSIECDRSAPIAEKCRDFESDLKAWGALGARLQIWDYTTQFTNFLAPFPNIATLKPNINLFVDNGANWIFEQHSHQWSDLYELRCWLTSQLLWNPSASYDSLLHSFCKGYYGTAAPLVEQYVRELEANIKAYPKFFLFLYGDPSQGFSSWLSGDKLSQWNRLFDEAEKKAGDDGLLLGRLHAARVGLDYATLEYYRLNKPPYLLADSAALYSQLNRFVRTCERQGIHAMNEMGLRRTDYVSAYRDFIRNGAAPNLARGARVTLLKKPVKYAGEDPQTLTDGTFGGWSFYANWLGFLDTLHATIDLGASTEFSSISTQFLQVTNHVVFFPTRVLFEISEDGQSFERVATISCAAPLSPQSKVNDIWQVSSGVRRMKARYVRVIGENMNTPPYWHHAAGTGAWIFVDELVLR